MNVWKLFPSFTQLQAANAPPQPLTHLHAAALILPNKRLPASVHIKSAIKRGVSMKRCAAEMAGVFI